MKNRNTKFILHVHVLPSVAHFAPVHVLAPYRLNFLTLYLDSRLDLPERQAGTPWATRAVNILCKTCSACQSYILSYS